MNKESLQKFYPVIIGLGILVPIVSIYFTFFRSKPEPEQGRKIIIQSDDPAKPAPAYNGGFSFPPKNGKVQIAGKELVLENLRQEIATSQQPKEVMQAVGLLGEAKDIYACPQLFELLNSPDVYVRGRAGAALTKILSIDFHYKAEEPEDKRKPIVAMMKKEYEAILKGMDKRGVPRN